MFFSISPFDRLPDGFYPEAGEDLTDVVEQRPDWNHVILCQHSY